MIAFFANQFLLKIMMMMMMMMTNNRRVRPTYPCTYNDSGRLVFCQNEWRSAATAFQRLSAIGAAFWLNLIILLYTLKG